MKVMQEKNIYMKEDFSDEDGIRAAELEEQFAGLTDGMRRCGNLLSGIRYQGRFALFLDERYKWKAESTGFVGSAPFGKPDNLLTDDNDLDLETVMWLEKLSGQYE